MPKIKIAKDTAVKDWGLPSEGSLENGVEIILDNVVGQGRWTTDHELLIRQSDKYYRTYYSVASTEIQDLLPWEYDVEVVLEEVYPKQVTTTVFVPVKD